MKPLPLLCLALLPVVVSTAADPEPDPAHLTWERMIDKTAEEHQIFVSESTTMSLDGIYTWVPVLTFGHRDDRDAALALFRELEGKFTKWAYDTDGRSQLKDFKSKYGAPPPPGGSYVALYSFGSGDRIQMTYRAPAKDVSSSLTITFFDFEKIRAAGES